MTASSSFGISYRKTRCATRICSTTTMNRASEYGNATGVTIGREYFNNNTHQTSMEWAILPYDNNSGVFSAPGDSGSIIVDGRGHFGDLLTGGAGKTESSDVTYTTPLFWVFPRIEANGFPDPHL